MISGTRRGMLIVLSNLVTVRKTSCRRISCVAPEPRRARVVWPKQGQDRHVIGIGLRGAGEDVRRAGPHYRQADARLAANARVAIGHVASHALVAGEDGPDLGRGQQRVGDLHRRTGGNAGHELDPFRLQTLD